MTVSAGFMEDFVDSEDVPLAFDPATGQNVPVQVSPRLSLPERFPCTPEMAARWR